MSALNIPNFPPEDFQMVFSKIKANLDQALNRESADYFPQLIMTLVGPKNKSRQELRKEIEEFFMEKYISAIFLTCIDKYVVVMFFSLYWPELKGEGSVKIEAFLDWLWIFLDDYKSRNPEKFNLPLKPRSLLDTLGAQPNYLLMDNFGKSNNFMDTFSGNSLNSGRLMMEKPIRGVSRPKNNVDFFQNNPGINNGKIMGHELENPVFKRMKHHSNNLVRELLEPPIVKKIKTELPLGLPRPPNMMDMNESPMMMKPIKKKKIKCRNWPNCRLQDCHFYHPTETCTNFPKCPYGKDCLYIHPVIECKFGLKCQRPNCSYTHPHNSGFVLHNAPNFLPNPNFPPKFRSKKAF